MKDPSLYRKRIIPNEVINLKDDIILHIDENVIVTKWNVLKPKNEFCRGFSCYFVRKGYKISKFIDKNDQLVYYYCDIIESYFDEQDNTYVFTDLLADVIVYENGMVKVVDLAEISEAMDLGLITSNQVKNCLKILDNLLDTIYKGELISLIEDYI